MAAAAAAPINPLSGPITVVGSKAMPAHLPQEVQLPNRLAVRKCGPLVTKGSEIVAGLLKTFYSMHIAQVSFV